MAESSERKPDKGRPLLERLGAFLFPPACVGCQAGGEHYLCSACRSSLRPGRSLVAGAELITLGAYEGVLQACLTAVKQQGHKSLARELAQMAGESAARCWGGGPERVVYSVRPSRAGQRLRGFSLPWLMERAVLERTDWKALSEPLAASFPDRETSSQGLNLEERLARQQGAPWQGRPAEGTGRGALLILDDVVTTGATLAAAVNAARELGFDPISCLALAVAADE